MNLRPLFWMFAGAGATLVAGAWGGRQSLPIPSDLQQTFSSKSPVLMEASVKTNSDYAAENVLSRTPWVRPKADPFGEKPVVIRRKAATVVEKREPPPLVFPFEYVGKLTADGKETLFLSKGEQIYPLAEGGILESMYRVDHIGSESIEISYLPDTRKMTIALESITAKHVPGAPSSPLNGMIGSIEPPPAVSFGAESVSRPTMDQPAADQKEKTADIQPMLAPPAPSPSSRESGQQSAAVPVPPSQPPVLMPPEMMPQGMLPSGLVLPPGMMPPGMMPPGAPQ